ncbi:MAG TPA: hypothetical protein VHT75_13740 [Acidimicrobiales bacterium]|jgi:hypothetical protein|nr:hypothetical protein [Acidimicrobiales bacterium]
MKLQWGRPGVIQVTATVEELALLVAAGRIAVAALEKEPGQQVQALAAVLARLDQAIGHLPGRPGAVT